MSEDKLGEDKFLVRWSRRKQEAKANATPPAAAMHDDVQSAPKPPSRTTRRKSICRACLRSTRSRQ